MSDSANNSQVTLSQIADLGQVELATVSNWRRRHKDFPEPTGENEKGRPLFDLVQVNAWLKKHGRLAEGASTKREMWEAMNALRGEIDADAALRSVCALAALSVVTREFGLGEPFTTNLSDALQAKGPNEALMQAFAEVQVTPAATTVYRRFASQAPDALRDLSLQTLDRGSWKDDWRTPTLITRTVGRLVSQQPHVQSILDPAAGSCGLLDAARQEIGHDVELYAQDVNRAQRSLGLQLLAFSGQACDYQLADTLESDAFTGMKFDAVVCEPPFGMRLAGPLPLDERWLLASPPLRLADSAWLQHCVSHVSSAGNAYVVLPPGLLFQETRGAVGLRRELVKRGMIEAIIGLPRALRRSTSIATTLWILRSAEAAVEGAPVLMASVDEAPSDDEAAEAVAESIAHIVSAWRNDGSVLQGEGVGAASVAVLDLLDGSVDLTPNRWIRQEASSDELEAWAEEAHSAPMTAKSSLSLDSLNEQSKPLELDDLPGQARGWVSVGDLIKQRQLSLVVPIPSRSADALSSDGRLEAVRVRDLQSPGTREVAYVPDPDSVKPAQLTQLGDVLFSAVGGLTNAWVESDDGRVLVAPLRGLRIQGDWITPRVLKFAIQAERNQRLLAGTSLMTVRPKHLQVPLLTPDETAALDNWLKVMEHYEQRAAATQETVISAKLSLSRLMSADPSN